MSDKPTYKELKKRLQEFKQAEYVRSLADKALSYSEEKYKTLLNIAPYGIQISDLNGLITYSNPAHHKIQGYTTGELIGKGIWDLVAGETQKNDLKKIYGRIIKNHPPPTTYFSVDQTKDGRLIDTQIDWEYIHNPKGEIEGVISIISDISDLKEAQKIKNQLSRMESISTLTGGVAHDFNNLLSIIMGNIELAETAMSPDNEGLKFLNSAREASVLASELTRQLMTFSKGGVPMKKLGSITGLLKEVANIVLADTNVACKFELPTELWSVKFDRNQIVHAISNLIDNAAESMPDGGTIIAKAENFIVTAKQRLPITKGKYIKLSILDHGVGITKDHLPLVFDPYFSTKKKGSQKGMGLGLTTTYSIITRHDGYINVESDPGIGSCFTIYLSAYEKTIELNKVTKD